MGKRNQAMRPIETKLSSNISGGSKDDDIKEEEEENQPLSPAGSLFREPNFNVHILAIMGCKTKIDPEVAKANAKANLPRTLMKHPHFTSLPVVDEKDGEMKWVKTKVDLDNHIIVQEINLANIYKDCPDKFLEDYIFNLSKTRLDKSMPLWDLHILDLKTSEAKGVGIFRIHHSLGDGVSLMSLLLACTRQTSNPEALPTIPTKKSKTKDKTSFVRESLFWMWWVLNLFWNTLVDVLMFCCIGVVHSER